MGYLLFGLGINYMNNSELNSTFLEVEFPSHSAI